MKFNNKLRSVTAAIATVALVGTMACVGLAGCTSSSASGSGSASASASVPATRTVTDMAGRSVEIPGQIRKVATFGSVGVINTFVECMGMGDTIANEMPANFTKNDQWAMQYKLAPQIKGAPLVETADGIDIEATLTLAPDLCITMTEATAQQLQEKGIPCIVIAWNDTEDVKTAVNLMGEIFNVPDRAKEYNAYFDAMVKKAADITAKIPESERKTVIYGDMAALKNPHIISEWWISAAGGKSVTADAHKKNTLEYSMEDLLNWQPQIAFSSSKNVQALYDDANYAQVPAVQNKAVYPVPTVAHVWGNRTVEQPLTVMWALNKMYPEKYSEADLTRDIKDFYAKFFEYNMTDDEVKNIINYGQK